MPRSAPRYARKLSVIGVAALAATVSFGVTPSAASGPTLTATVREATRAGLAPGQAYMGWSDPGTEQSPASVAGQQASSTVSARAATVSGMDVSGWQRTVNWRSWKNKGKQFAYVKATEGTGFRNPYFSSQYRGSYKVGMIRGAYHFALPSRASGYAQATYFVRHGGGWSRDGRTLPGVLDIEYNPYGSTCYGLSKKSMVAWVKSFTRRYKSLTGRDAVIYTTRDWWSRCTGNSRAFNRTNPLWIARYSSSVGALPGGWPFYTFWQYTTRPLDQNRFNGSRARLIALARG